MKANINTKKKSSVKKKLLPAAGSLAISAVMLSTSTYAWFTMSKEVEVTGIQMTASVPDNLEISLGKNMSTGTLALNATEGLQNATDIDAPLEADWSNSVRVSDYYKFGYILPASSDTGLDVFYTEDANAAGKSVAVNGSFTQADTALGAGMTTYGVGATYSSYNPETATKGYYIDIPVWFRTSSKDANVDLKVQATIIDRDNSSSGTTEKLYKAARVSILKAGSTTNTADGQKVIADNAYQSAGVSYYNRYDSSWVSTPQAVGAAGSLGGTPASGNTAEVAATEAGVKSAYKQAKFITQAATSDAGATYTGDTVVSVTKNTSANPYGDAVEYTIRVWLEGEDVNCWDATAGQNFTVDLKFFRATAPKAATAANQTGG